MKDRSNSVLIRTSDDFNCIFREDVLLKFIFNRHLVFHDLLNLNLLDILSVIILIQNLDVISIDIKDDSHCLVIVQLNQIELLQIPTILLFFHAKEIRISFHLA